MGMKSFFDYPRKSRIMIVAGSLLLLFGICGLAYEYHSVQWWHLLVDRVHLAIVAMFPIVVILLGACLASRSGREMLDELLHPKAKRPVHRSREDRRVMGLCGGFAESRQANSSFVRLIVLLLFAAFPTTVLIVYLILTVLVDSE